MLVALSHPQVQHAFRAAKALAEANRLACLYTSIAFAEPASRVPRSFGRRWRTAAGIPESRIRRCPWPELARLALQAMLTRSYRVPLNFATSRLFDLCVSRRIRSSGASIVTGYETACLRTFRAAKSANALCVLDAASVHFSAQSRNSVLPGPAALRSRINATKAAEIDLADHVLTLSQFGRQTYLEAGVPPEKVSVIPLGVDTKSICPGDSDSSPTEVFHFLFVGNLSYSKGIDILLEAFHGALIPHKHLTLVGAPGDAAHLLRRASSPHISAPGYLPQPRILAALRSAQILIQPSRFEGFGQSVLEAMATAVPVIVSSNVGAKDLVDAGASGWVFRTGDIDDLRRCMEEAASMPARQLLQMGRRARRTAEAHTWARYSQDIRAFYESLI